MFRRGAAFRVPRKMGFPLFVKSVTEDASLGIAQASIVADADKLKERIEFIHEQTDSDALIEEYIEGRELYVGVLGNDRLAHVPGVGDGSSARCPTSWPASRPAR